MACRTNLKKEKRARNRINAFRFKKSQPFRRRFNGPDYAADQKKADEDNKFYSLVFTYSAEAEALAAEEAKKQEAKEANEARAAREGAAREAPKKEAAPAAA